MLIVIDGLNYRRFELLRVFSMRKWLEARKNLVRFTCSGRFELWWVSY